MNRSTSPNAMERPTLALMARKGLWPTPTASNASYSGAGYGPTLEQTAKTPPASGDAHPKIDAPQGNLNPEWVEMLMGFPPGYTNINGPLDLMNRKQNTSRHVHSRKAPPAETSA